MRGGEYGEETFSFTGVVVFFDGFDLYGGIDLEVLRLGKLVTPAKRCVTA
jgi:hypothetical protein